MKRVIKFIPNGVVSNLVITNFSADVDWETSILAVKVAKGR